MSGQRPILLLGPNGQVGWELRRSLACLGPVIVAGLPKVDLADSDSLRAVVQDVAPGLIVNAAAYTAVDNAESEPDLAMAVNGTAPGVLAEEAKRLNIPFVHYSTDYVFEGGDGVTNRPWLEVDTPRPINVYGRTKLAGETAVAASGGTYLILRTSWVYGQRGSNFLLTIQRLAHERDELTIVSDQIGSPTWCRMIAEATALALAANWLATSRITDLTGLYHLSAAGETSWHGFATSILALNGARTSEKEPPRVTPIGTDAYPTPARRPAYSVLNNQRFRDTFGFGLSDWQTQLAMCLER